MALAHFYFREASKEEKYKYPKSFKLFQVHKISMLTGRLYRDGGEICPWAGFQ